MAAIAQRGADVSNGLSSASSRLHSTVVCQNSFRGWPKGARRAAVGGNVPRTRSVGRPTRGAQNPNRPHAREPSAPATTRPAPPPLQATSGRSPRPRLLDVALAVVGTVARSAPCRSAADRDSLAPAGLPRVLELEVATRSNRSSARRFGDRRARPHHGPRQPPLGRAAHPWRASQARSRRLTTHGWSAHASPCETALADLADLPRKSRRDLVSVDFFVVPTATFRVLYVFVVLLHHRRRVVHFNVTDSPTAAWTAQQVVEAFPHDSAPRFLIHDRDGIFGGQFRQRVKAIGLAEVLTTPRSPWQNPFAERVIGTIRRELLDHVIVLNERHLRRRLRNYLRYYHGSRTHLALAKDAPEPRAVEPPAHGQVVALPQVGGLHHRYVRRAA